MHRLRGDLFSCGQIQFCHGSDVISSKDGMEKLVDGHQDNFLEQGDGRGGVYRTTRRI